MIEGGLSRRYSKALFQLAGEAGQDEVIGEQLASFLAAYNGSPLRTVLGNPAFGLDSRKEIISQVSTSLQVAPLTANFLALLLDRDRLALLPSIVASYRRLINQSKGRVEATVVGAEPLDSAVLERLRDALRQLSGKDVILQQQSDPALIAGLVLELEGKIYDSSVRTQLNKMKQRVVRGF
jgi:F-type H+-transporting ATPase subunit delta